MICLHARLLWRNASSLLNANGIAVDVVFLEKGNEKLCPNALESIDCVFYLLLLLFDGCKDKNKHIFFSIFNFLLFFI